MKLYGYYRSSATYRVRLALNLKGLDYSLVPVNLIKNEQRTESWLGINPQGLIPLLETDSGERISQSVAIVEYLEEAFPQTRLLPEDRLKRSRIRAMVNSIACDIHPLDNLRVLRYLEKTLKVSNDEKLTWYRHWIKLGFSAIENNIESNRFCFDGNEVSMADVFLIPQVYNALRFDVDISEFSKIQSVYEHCIRLPGFIKAAPENQPDAP